MLEFCLFERPRVSVRRLQVTDGTTVQRDPSWSLDGQRIVFVSNAGGTYDIFSLDATASMHQLLNDAGEPAWKEK
jgi:Tol biopolymer transport system component